MKINHYFSRISKSKFFRRLTVLVSGNVIARFFPIVFLPFLSRLYPVESFALLGVFVSLITLLNSLTSGNFEYAILLPEDDRDARKIKILSILICMCVSVIVLIILCFISDYLKYYLHTEKILFFLFFIPVSLITNTFYASEEQWVVRKQYFKALGFSHVLNSGLTAGLQIFFGVISIKELGLIIGTILGNFVSGLFLFCFSMVKEKQVKENFIIKRKDIVPLIKQYKDFPLYRMPGIFVNKLQNSMPMLLFNLSFSQVFLGYYSMARKVLALPLTVIGHSVGNVFASEAATQIRKKHSCFSTYKKTFLFLLVSGILGTLLLVVFIPFLVPIFLGKDWIGIELVIRILSFRLLFSFISNPLSRVYRLVGKLKQNFYFQIIQAGVMILSLVVAVKIFGELGVLWVFSIVSSVLYILYVSIGYKYSKKSVIEE